jgi:ABC-type multidrug transport system ATPase subunit
MITINRLERRFGGREVIGGIDLEVGAGERVGLHGPNGSGKSTILRCVAGTLTPSGGEVLVGGHPAGSVAARSLVGVSLSQERAFDLRLSGRENLLFFARLRLGRERAARRTVADVIDELELDEIAAQRVANCSTGMVQQLAFARSLVGEPPCLTLDEPTRSLDEDARERLWGALDRRPHLALLIATHRDDDLDNCTHTLDLEP